MPVNRKKMYLLSSIGCEQFDYWLIFLVVLWTYNKKNLFVLESYGWTFSFIHNANDKSETC